MAQGESSASQTQTQGSARGGSQGQRRGRGGRPRGQRDGNNTQGQGRKGPSNPTDAVDPSQQGGSQRNRNAPEAGNRSRRGGRARATGRGAASRGVAGTTTQRAFGGHLTTADDVDDTASVVSLSGDAPEFVPGQPVVSRPRKQAQKHSHPSMPKSTALDLPTRIHEDISSRNYECAICTDDVLRVSHVWSCTLCWTVVHLKCARKWHQNQKKQLDAQPSEPQSEPSWRCPGCNSKLLEEPGTYHCWCGKDINPRPASNALPPHSCGQTCSKPRATCPHPCPLQCHAGPCPPCDLMGPVQTCFCGSSTSQVLCRETDYENGRSCGQLCDDFLPCGEHTCSRPCHPGLCGECDTPVDAKCYCGREEKQMPCYEREEPQSSFDPKQQTWFDGTFSCEQQCERAFDCGNHTCSETCHAQDEQPAHCPYSPDVIADCPCGKTPLSDLLTEPRQSCGDPIPHCDKPCEKLLACGHLCQSKCHTGDCGFCFETIDITCRCGRVSSKSMCHQGDIQHPQCFRVCQANLSCGRHKCGERCCPGEKKATERAAAKRKHKVPSQTTAIEAEHICIKTCGRPSKCGSHNCQQICHRGPCGSCPEAIFHEISCDCGRTVLHPPQPCGTRPPECRFNCLRRPTCGHPAIEHNCHGDDVSCPKCPFLVDKWCACGKEKLHSQPCHLQEAHCGRPCGQKLQCGLHNCKKLCHKPGQCQDEGSSDKRCDQTCGKTKLFCDHPCQTPCHGQTPCNESSPCTAKVAVYCPCGLRKQEIKCLASSSNTTPERPELKCDDECLRMDRNRRLAAALNIDSDSHQNDHVPYSDVTLRLFQDSTPWAEAQEREFRVFSKSPTEARLRYKPMPNTQRQFLHSLAEDYGLESKSEDIEPHRYVVVFKGQRFVSAPSKTLAQCVKIRAAQAAEVAASRPPTPPALPVSDPFNAFLLTAPRFGLTIEDVKSAFESDFASQPSLHYTVDFLPSDEVLLKFTAQYSAFLAPAAMEQALTALKPKLLEAAERTQLAGNILLCHVDDHGEVSRRENLTKRDASGWSAVAGRAAVKKETVASADEGSARGSGRKLLGLRKKKVEKGKPWASQLDGDVEC